VTIYPNPFDQSTTLDFELKTSSEVSIEIYNLIGGRIQTLVNQGLEAGKHTYTFGEDRQVYPNGIYVVKITIDKQVYVTRLIKQN
jgi:hypothetical protein